MIRVENLVKTYGSVHALDGLSLQVEPGVVYGFLGPNGAGKTTTLRILSGLARPDRGQAWIMDQPVTLKQAANPGGPARRMLGVLPEEPAFYAWMTPRELLKDLVAPLHGLKPVEAAQREDESRPQWTCFSMRLLRTSAIPDLLNSTIRPTERPAHVSDSASWRY